MIYFEGHFTQGNLDELLRTLGPETFFVQIGANDGVIGDPICDYVKELGWQGLLIEPMPDVFAQLQANYSMCPGLLFDNVAIADYDGQIELLRGTDQVAQLYPNHTVASINEEQSFFAINDQRLISRISVKCNRLETVLTRHAIERIDLFVVDVEGADWIVTRQLPLDRFLPAVVYCEFFQLSRYEKLAFGEHFRNHGYRIYVSDRAADVLAVRWPAVRSTALMRKIPFFLDLPGKR